MAGKDLTDSCKSEGLCRLKEGENHGLWLYCHRWSDEWTEELTTVVIVRIAVGGSRAGMVDGETGEA